MKPNERLDGINIGLMVVAATAAIIAPFHLFLFAYAILGPLHYLTEISWLHERRFFTPRRGARMALLMLIVITAAVMLFGYVCSDLLHHPIAPVWEIGLFLFVFAAAAIAQYTQHVVNAAALLVMAGIVIAIASGHTAYGVIGFLLITVIHVFLFTGAFLLQGARRSRSRLGYLSFAVFLAAAAVTLLIPVRYVDAGGTVRVLYAAFEQLNLVLLRMLGKPPAVYESASIGVMRFIAYAYTYHYLNWFSKTSVIRWHRVGRARGVAIALLWLAGVSAYVINYQVGFALFYILSAAHVMLEFPLNHQTFVGLSRSVVVEP